MFDLIKKKCMESSVLLAIVYTIGHIFIAMWCNYLITGARLDLAVLDALIEPVVNGFWFYAIHKLYRYYTESKDDSAAKVA